MSSGPSRRERGSYTVEDIVYRHIDGQSLGARLYRPDTAGRHPGVVEVHGGAWVGGDRLSDEGLNTALAERGIVVLSLDFRAPPQGRFPHSVRDVTAGIEWMYGRRDELGISDRIGALGNSSGGHQVLLSALRPDDERFHSAGSGRGARLDFVVLCWSVIDPVARYEWARGIGGRPDLAAKHVAYWGDVETMSQGSPRQIVADRTHTQLPALLAVQGTADENLPPTMLAGFAESYREIGGQIEVALFDGKSHNFAVRDPDDPDSLRAIELIADFILNGKRTSNDGR